VQNLLKDRNEQIPQEDIKKAAREIKEKFGYVVPDGDLIAEFAKFDKKREVAPGNFQVS
jgi:actin-related protein 3